MMKNHLFFLLLLTVSLTVFAQSEAAYDSKEKQESPGLIDPSRLTVHHAASFGMSSGGASDLKSQSLYSTMMQYQLSKPVTLDLNFSLPIHSTYNKAFNLSSENIESASYLSSIPFDASVSWRPRENLLLRLTVARDPGMGYYGYNSGYSIWGHGPQMFNPLFPERSER